MTGWRDRSACAGADPDLFIGPDYEGSVPRARREALARAVCADCPVKAECARFAITRGIGHGVWGGMGEDELRARRNLGGRQAAGARTAAVLVLRLREPVLARLAAGEKPCAGPCGMVKPLGEFTPDASRADGRARCCGPCRAEAARGQRAKARAA